MSTRACIARSTGIGTFEGTYNHSDGYPTGLGKGLWDNLQKYGAEKVLHRLLVEHTAGWSFIWHADLFEREPVNAREMLAATLPRDVSDYEVAWYYPEHEGPMSLDQDSIADSWCEYLYLINPRTNTLTVMDVCGDEPVTLALLDLAGPEPDWRKVQDGEYAKEGTQRVTQVKLGELPVTESGNR